MKRRIALVIVLAVAAPASGKKAPVYSWGKAGVTLEAYRADALACGLRGYYTDISRTSQAQAFVSASKQINTTYEAGQQRAQTGDPMGAAQDFASAQRQADAIAPERKMKELRTVMLGQQATCLTEKGYTRFVLTDAQAARLAKLKPGSDARRAFLFELGADGAVLGAQAVPAGS